MGSRTDPKIENSELKEEVTDYDAYKQGMVAQSDPTAQPSTQDIFSSTKTTIIHEDKEQTPITQNDMVSAPDLDLARLGSAQSGQKSSSFDRTPSQPLIENILSSTSGWNESVRDLELTQIMDEMSTLDRKLSATECEEQPRR